MQRIGQSLQRQVYADQAGSARPVKRLGLGVLMLAIIVAAGSVFVWRRSAVAPTPATGAALSAPLIHDRYPLELPIEPQPGETRPATGQAAGEVQVQAISKRVNEGVVVYGGNVLASAGPWKISCQTLSVFRSANGSTLLDATGQVMVNGIRGPSFITADEATLNTETSEMRLSGHGTVVTVDVAESFDAAGIDHLGKIRYVGRRPAASRPAP